MKLLASFSLVVFFVVAGLFFTHSLNSINQDIGRHLKTGEIIWQTWHVPKVNLFSFTEPNTHFINHHWLSEVVFYLLNSRIGLKGLILFKSLVLLATFWFLYEAVKKQVRPIAFIVAMIPGLIIISDRTDVRPEIFSFLFLAVFLWSIFKTKYDRDWRWLSVLPLVQIAWTNMHIYFAFGPMLLAIFAVDRYFNKDLIWKRVALICGLCGLATLVNPNTLMGALAPLTILGSYGYSIVENQSIFFLRDYGILGTQINFFLLISLAFVVSFIPALRQHGLRKYFFETIVAIIFVVLGGQMIRNFGPLAIVMTAIFALNIQAYLDRLSITSRMYRYIYITAVIGGIFLIVSVLNNKTYAWVDSGNRFGLDIPANAQGGVDFVLSHHLVGPVFNNFDVGSYLIWKLYPHQQVFVDGRPEAYTPGFFSNTYEPMQEDPQQWKHYADDVYHIEYVFFDYHDITPWAQTFLSFISKDQNWPMVYKDNSVVIFVRRTTHATLLGAQGSF